MVLPGQAVHRSAPPLIELIGLGKAFPIRGGLLGTVTGAVQAVRDVSFAVRRGEVFGLAGESGSGKSTIARAIMGLGRPTAGAILFEGRDITAQIGTRAYGKSVQMVFQNPGSSLNPRRSIGQSIAVPLGAHDLAHGRQRARIAELLEMVQLPTDFADRFPNELSGGQKQRVAIARALAVEPKLIVLDEPTSALDVSVQARIVELLTGLGRILGLTYLFISHDLSLMRNFADRIGVLYLGRLAEIGPTAGLFRAPAHPYTRSLIASVPVISDEDAQLKPDIPIIEGEVPSPANLPSGCEFHTRCPYAFTPCPVVSPDFTAVETDHRARCHLLTAAAA